MSYAFRRDGRPRRITVRIVKYLLTHPPATRTRILRELGYETKVMRSWVVEGIFNELVEMECLEEFYGIDPRTGRRARLYRIRDLSKCKIPEEYLAE